MRSSRSEKRKKVVDTDRTQYDLITEMTLYPPENGGLRYGFESGFRGAHFAFPDDPIAWVATFDAEDGFLLSGETGTVYMHFIMGVAHLIGSVSVGTTFFQIGKQCVYGSGIVLLVLDLEAHAERDRNFEEEWAKHPPEHYVPPSPTYRRTKKKRGK